MWKNQKFIQVKQNIWPTQLSEAVVELEAVAIRSKLLEMDIVSKKLVAAKKLVAVAVKSKLP